MSDFSETRTNPMNTNDPIPTLFGLRAKSARVAAGCSALGFLAGLGFLPGCERLVGFSGFFGLIGLAVMIEAISRVRCRRS
jgi:hypothetical protein